MSILSVPFIRSTYNYDMAEASADSGLSCPEPTLAQQSSRDETDINVMMSKFARTGELPVTSRMPSYQDFEGIFDFATALQAVMEAERAFDSLPANVRFRFSNDPQQFVSFCSDPANQAEAASLGLLNPTQPAPSLAPSGADKPVV